MEVKDSIMEKLRKIKALMDGGEAGEVEAARLALERLMEANGLTWDDIMDEKRTTRAVKYANQDEFKILVNLLAHLFGLYNSTPDENRENKLSFEDLMRLKMIADGIESSPYAKMIEHE